MSADLLGDVRVALAAASETTGDIATVYLAIARVRLAAASAEVSALELLVAARETAVVASKGQTPLDLEGAK